MGRGLTVGREGDSVGLCPLDTSHCPGFWEGSAGCAGAGEGNQPPGDPENPDSAMCPPQPGFFFTHLTFLTSPLGSWPPGRRTGSKLEYLRFLGRPGPRLAGLRELSSLLAATGEVVRGSYPRGHPDRVQRGAGRPF